MSALFVLLATIVSAQAPISTTMAPRHPPMKSVSTVIGVYATEAECKLDAAIFAAKLNEADGEGTLAGVGCVKVTALRSRK